MRQQQSGRDRSYPVSIPTASDATAVNHGCTGDYRQRRKRAGAGGANDEINEFDAASAAVERGVAVPGGAAGRFAGAGYY